MQSAPENFQHAASFDWEALLPVLFFLLYGIAQLLGSKTKKQLDPPRFPAQLMIRRSRITSSAPRSHSNVISNSRDHDRFRLSRFLPNSGPTRKSGPRHKYQPVPILKSSWPSNASGLRSPGENSGKRVPRPRKWKNAPVPNDGKGRPAQSP